MAKKQQSGRFLKKDNPVVKHLSLLEYSFADLSAKYINIMTTDNISSNIILKDLHSQVELDTSVKTPPDFDQILNDETRPNSQIIMPSDFTNDWEAMRSKKSNLPDENEYLERMYEEEIFKNAQNKGRHSNTPTHANRQQHSSENEDHVENPSAASPSYFKVIPSNQKAEPAKTIEPPREMLESLSQTSQAQIENLKNLGNHIEPNLQTNLETEDTETFIPSFAGSSNSVQPEADAITQYKEQLKREVAEAEVLKKQAQANGYEDGFREGEQKGIMQARKITEQLFQSMQSLIGDLEGLRRDLIKQANANFYEIAQAISQSLIHRELSLNPAAFATLIEQAVADIVPTDQFTIKVSPNMADKLKTIKLGEVVQSRIVADTQIHDSDFVIDSKLSSLRADLPSLIAAVIEKIKDPIFSNQSQEPEDANIDSGKKAG